MNCKLSWLSIVFLCATVVSADGQVVYRTQIKPILAERCFSCHGALRKEAGLRLDAALFLRKGGDSGQLISTGKSAESLLLQRITSQDAEERMPQEGKPLTAEQIALLSDWIDQGAIAPDDEPIPPDPRQHWAFQPPQRPAIPNTAAKWVRHEIDQFIAGEHQQRGLIAAAEAPRSILLRRVYLDLIGLPPTRDELHAFLADTSPEAYERAVDRLLDSPRYGERWARHWMDVWRYSDPSGYGNEIRDSREHIWRWRDWIIDSLNADKGYDRMITEMLAADEAAPDDEAALRATGFLARNWYKFSRNAWLDNIVEHSSKAFLGITLNCARCHDHKYDPISQEEYYQMRAVFEPHDVRDDPAGPVADSALMVRAFDANAATPTYLFVQGDENQPDKDRHIKPAGAAVFGGKLRIEPIELPVGAYYPALRPETQQAALIAADGEIDKAQEAIQQAHNEVERAELALADFEANPPRQPRGNDDEPAITDRDSANQPPIILDDFSTLDPNRWTVESGNWTAAAGRLTQDRGDSLQYRLLSRVDHPRDFRARLRLQITGGDVYRSAGLGFDVHGKAMHAIYLSAAGSKVQVTLQSPAGQWAYPQTGAKSLAVELNREYLLEVVVRDRLLNVSVDGKLAIAFTLPADRQPGKIAIWTFSAITNFDEIQVEGLPTDVKVVGKVDMTTPADEPATKTDLESAVAAAEARLEIARLHHAAAETQREALAARYDAERAKYGSDAAANQLALAAGRAQRLALVRKLEEQLARDRWQLAEAKQKQVSGDAKAQQALEAAEKNFATHEQQLSEAKAKLDADDANYQSLGPTYPKTSTGRRLALARWITDRQNPLAARVAVNHIWLRHFDEPLVERMFDFGLRSPKPAHAKLLDGLAVQFMDDGWSMKKLHKLMVTSGVYRFSSSNADGPASNRTIDADNRFFWRMNPRRAEAESVRDSILHLGGSLDITTGGPPIDHNQGQTVYRRSIYFRHDKERQMTFLNLFDGAKVNECYRRQPTVAPQQALAMYNSGIAVTQSQTMVTKLPQRTQREFITALFEHVLCRQPTPDEMNECETFLTELTDKARARQQLALVLLNHNDFVTIR